MTDFDDLIAQLASIEERLRDLAYDRLRTATEDGDADAAAEERQILKARRAVERAIHALGGTPEE
ncbi:MAG: hypothetical protein MUP67_05800 [Acidimicrobiia bacterium]|nr:hypothetical protein [Acidimicrobiia bacterium]